MSEIPVTYQCLGCGSEEAVLEETDEPVPSKTIWNLCKDCQEKGLTSVNERYRYIVGKIKEGR